MLKFVSEIRRPSSGVAYCCLLCRTGTAAVHTRTGSSPIALRVRWEPAIFQYAVASRGFVACTRPRAEERQARPRDRWRSSPAVVI